MMLKTTFCWSHYVIQQPQKPWIGNKQISQPDISSLGARCVSCVLWYSPMPGGGHVAIGGCKMSMYRHGPRSRRNRSSVPPAPPQVPHWATRHLRHRSHLPALGRKHVVDILTRQYRFLHSTQPFSTHYDYSSPPYLLLWFCSSNIIHAENCQSSLAQRHLF